MTLRPSTAPRWKIAISSFARAERPWANAVRARNDGAKPRLTTANAPFLRNTRRDVIICDLRGAAEAAPYVRRSTSLELRRAESERDHLRRARGLLDRRSSRLRHISAEHRIDERPTFDFRLLILDCRA